MLDGLARYVLGMPSRVCGWSDLVRLRDTLDRLVNAEINRRQADPHLARTTLGGPR